MNRTTMKITHPFTMKIASIITILMLVSYTALPVMTAYAEDGASSTSSAGDGGGGGSGGSGDSGAGGGSGGDGGTSSGSADSGSSSSDGGTGGTGGTGGDSTSGTGTGGDGGTGGTGGDATNTADGGSSDATAGDGGTGGAGGDAQNGGTAGNGGTGAGGGDADANSQTDNGSNADADANGGTGGAGGDGGDGSGASTDGGDAGNGAQGGDAESDANAQNGGDAGADATGGDGGAGGTGGDGGSAGDVQPDGVGSVIETGNASGGSSSNGSSNVSNVTTPMGTEDDESEVEFENVLGATTTASSTAETGENEIEDPDGAFIKTGIADSFAYLISLFNIAITNSTGSIMFLKNPIGDALNFTSKFMEIFGEFAKNGTCSLVDCEMDDAALEIYNENVAEVTNSAVTRSHTGLNGATSTDGISEIDTGDASAFSGIVNIGNLTIYDSRYLLILMANEGDLSGDILLPDGAFFDKLSTGAKIGARSDIRASSTADVVNLADATTETGANGANGTEESTVDTGDAHSTASTVNFVNQLGAPICFVVNVGGTWNGNVVQMPSKFSRATTPFGDVICGAGGESRDPVTGVELETENYAKILNEAIAEAVTGSNYAEGLVAKVKTGDATAFAQILNLVNMHIIGQDWIFANFAVGGNWDGDLVFGVKPGEDDVLGELIEEHVTGGGSRSSGGGGSYSSASPNITFTKEASVTQAQSPAVVEYVLTVYNSGGTARNVIIEDTMKGPDGKVIGKQMWNLGTVKADEEVKIKYTIEFKGDVIPGYYTNAATMTGYKNNGNQVTTLNASDIVEVLPPGIMPGAACEPVLTEYIKPWRVNNPEQVKKLQSFLNAYEGTNLAESGAYDPATQGAVKAFQSKYAAEVLTPWGINHATGNVYYTTQKKVNQMACADMDFSLSAEQQAEIERFKNSTPAQQEEVVQQGNTGYLLMPAPQMPVFFRDASQSQGASTSALLKQQFKGLASWLMFAPFVEALEL